MASPFQIAKEHPNEIMLDHRNSSLKIQEPFFFASVEDANYKKIELQKNGHLVFLYNIDENGNTKIINS